MRAITQTFLDALREKTGRDPRPSNGGWQAHCPVHDDWNPSLSINEGEKGVVLHCHAGCEARAVVEAVGLTEKDLFYPSPDTRDRRREVTHHYDYTDADGSVLYRVVRYDPKGFSQERPDGCGKWIPNLNGVERVLYRLPEVWAAIRRDETICLVEGEKDADNLHALGLTATTNSGGAGKWQASYTEALRDAHMVILPDNDPPGKKHAEAVRTALDGVAKSVCVLELPGLPPKGDVTDWIEQGHAKGELEALVFRAMAPLFVSIAEVKPERIEWLWRAWLPAGRIILLDGDPGIGKSTLSLDWAARISTGRPFPGDSIKRNPAGVLLLGAEDSLGDTVRPRLEAMGADLTRIKAMRPDSDHPLYLPTGCATVERAAKDIGAALIVCDPLMAFLPSEINAYRDQDVRGVIRHLATVCERTGAAIVLVRHFTKAKEGRAVHRGGGSIGIVGGARVGLIVTSHPEDPNRRVLACCKNNLGPMPRSLTFRLVTAENGVSKVEWGEGIDRTADELVVEDQPEGGKAIRAACEFLKERLADGPVNSDDIKRDAGHRNIAWRTLVRAKEALDIHAEKVGKPGERGYWRWRLPDVGILGTLRESWHSSQSEECQTTTEECQIYTKDATYS